MDYRAIVLKATVFRTLTGYTVKEYQNLYRFYRAANDLLKSNNSIVTISFENGFSSQQAFTKSFVAKYKISPAKFRNIAPVISSFPPQNLFEERGISMELKKSFDNVQFVRKDDFFVIGIETDINYNGIGKGTDYIGDLYDRWNGEKLIETIPNQVNHKLCYGVTPDLRTVKRVI